MKGKKNDFSITFVDAKNIVSGRAVRLLHLHYVHSTRTALYWASKKLPSWQSATHYHLYERRTRKYLGTYKIDDWDALYPVNK